MCSILQLGSTTNFKKILRYDIFIILNIFCSSNHAKVRKDGIREIWIRERLAFSVDSAYTSQNFKFDKSFLLPYNFREDGTE